MLVADDCLGYGWRDADKNQLCYSCCDCEQRGDKRLYEGYLAAIISRYWQLIGSNYLRGKGAYSVQDCYNWLIDSILGTLREKSWLNPKSSLYNDPIAPDKSINVRMQSHRQGFYQWSNCKKRSGQFTLNTSYEGLYEAFGDSAFPEDNSLYKDAIGNLCIYDLIVSEFNNKNYMGSFVVYGIINANVIDVVQKEGKIYTQFNKGRLTSYVRRLDTHFCKEFSMQYNIPLQDVELAVSCCKKLKRRRVDSIIDNTIGGLTKKLSLQDRIRLLRKSNKQEYVCQ